MRKIIVIPAVLIGCLVVIWVGTVAAARMPSQELLAPTLTAGAPQPDIEMVNIKDDAQINSQGIAFDKVRACTLPFSYPAAVRQWCPLIESAANETGLPGNLIAAVILQESGGNPLSYSSSGAVGLMQVMPRDGLAADFMCANGPCFASRPTIEELQNPDYNIQFGSQMLAELLTKHGSYREALFRYGPMDIGYQYADLVIKIWENYQ